MTDINDSKFDYSVAPIDPSMIASFCVDHGGRTQLAAGVKVHDIESIKTKKFLKFE